MSAKDNPDTDPRTQPESTDPEITEALERLRAADPARTAAATKLTVETVLNRQQGEQELDETPTPLASAGPRTMARRTRWLLAAAAIVIALGLTATLIVRFALPGDAPLAGEPVVPPPDVSCDAPVEAGEGVPDGALSVRLCGFSGEEHDLGLHAPPELLTEDVAGLVQTYLDLEPMAEDAACPAIAGPSFSLVFGYAEGDPVRITSDFGCGSIGGRLGADAVLEAFADRLRTQRAAQGGPTGEVPPLDCTRGTWIVPRIDELGEGQAVLCATQQDGSPRMIPIDSSDWETLQADLAANVVEATEPPEPCGELPIHLVASNAYGDQLSITLACDIGWWSQQFSSDSYPRWEMTPESYEIIAGLLES